jgi:hypothetical protein
MPGQFVGTRLMSSELDGRRDVVAVEFVELVTLIGIG